MIIYTVRPGDSIYQIARRYNVTPEDIAETNGIDLGDSLVVGQSLIVPTDTSTHIVNLGESLYLIARQYNVSLDQLLAANPQISSPYIIQPGQSINIPAQAENLGNIDVNGYAYPNISMSVLEATLPHLTYLSIFSYHVRPDGSLSQINDTPLINAARQQRVAPLMVITNIDDEEGFSSDLARTILRNETVQNNLINNVINTIRNKNYAGVDVDFEYIYPDDRQNYNNFLQKLSDRLRPNGYTLTTAIAPKVRADQPGTLYEAHDYDFHGQIADHVIIMTYEWGFTFGPPLPVAPINEVRRVLDYAVTAIPPEKILMGMPNYGYNWRLPYVPGTAAQTVTNQGAVHLARREGAEIIFNTQSQAPFFEYYDDQAQRHIVWFDDARSIDARLRLVNEFGLGGLSYWTINNYFPAQWVILENLYNVNKVL